MSDRRRIYEAYLLSEHWANLRQQAFIVAGHKCEACYAKERLVGHHITYREPLESCTKEDIMCLCAPCHDRLHVWLNEHRKKPSYFDREQTVQKIREMPVILAPMKPAPPKVTQLPAEIAEAMLKLSVAELADYNHFKAKAPPSSLQNQHNYAIKRVQKIHKRNLKHLRFTKNKLKKAKAKLAPTTLPPKDRVVLLEETIRKLLDRVVSLEQEVQALKRAA